MLKDSLRAILSLPWEELLLVVWLLALLLLRLLRLLGVTEKVAKSLAKELSIQREDGNKTEQGAVSKNGK
jgi:hypothetical protein